MRKRIYRYMVLVTFIVSIILTLLLSFIFYGVLSSQYKDYVKSKAMDFAFILNTGRESEDFLEKLNIEERVTLIDPAGNVIFDNYADSLGLENHGERPEVAGANDVGYGEAKRYSQTVSKETYYYAIKLESGDVLRVAITTDTVFNIFADNIEIILLVILVMLILGHFVAVFITNKILDPFSKIDFEKTDEVFYDELTPYFNKIKEQKEELTTQINNIKYQNDTITTITNNMQEGIILIDERSTILTYNPSVEHILGTDEDFNGRNILALFRNPELVEALKHLEEEKIHRFTFDKDKNQYLVSVSPVYRNNKIKGTVILFLDVTKKAQLDKFRREFSANVSHELKTPLMSIMGYAELIESGLAKEEDRDRFISKIKTEASNMTSLIEDILLISEMDEGISKGSETGNSFKEENIKEIVLEEVEKLNEFTLSRSIEIYTNCEDVKHMVNRRLFSEVVHNLVYNAIAYNVDKGKIFVDLKKVNNNLEFVVRDTGIGIDEEHQARIFERFYRVEKSRNKRIGGTGLGLSIVKNATVYHGGVVTIESALGVGTTFKVVI